MEQRTYVCWVCGGELGASQAAIRAPVPDAAPEAGRTIVPGGELVHVACLQPFLERAHARWHEAFVFVECECCGRPVYLDRRRVRKHRVCTDLCRERLRSSSRPRPQPRVFESRSCASCGVEFTAVRQGHRYCSGACKQRAYRRRRAERNQPDG